MLIDALVSSYVVVPTTVVAMRYHGPLEDADASNSQCVSLSPLTAPLVTVTPSREAIVIETDVEGSERIVVTPDTCTVFRCR